MVNGKRRDHSKLRKAVADIEVNDKKFFNVSGRQPETRDAYKSVHGIAYQLWGPGSYSMERKVSGFWLVRHSVGNQVKRRKKNG